MKKFFGIVIVFIIILFLFSMVFSEVGKNTASPKTICTDETISGSHNIQYRLNELEKKGINVSTYMVGTDTMTLKYCYSSIP